MTLCCQNNNHSDNKSQNNLDSKNKHIETNQKSFMVFAHRGGGRKYAPDNSLPNIRYAIENKLTAIEVDLIQTKDDRIVLWNQLSVPKWYVDPSADKSETVLISELTYEEIKNVHYYRWIRGKNWKNLTIVTGEELIREIKNKINLILDKKLTMPLDLLIDFITRHEIAKQCMIAFGIHDKNVVENVQKVRTQLPEASILMGTGNNFEESLIQKLNQWGVDCAYSAKTKSKVDILHKYNILASTSYRTMNQVFEANGSYKSILTFGIDCAMTDDPIQLKKEAIEFFGHEVFPEKFISFFELIKKPRINEEETS
jgi:glycerophosphoryl diester phosphodiesterase